MQDLMFMAVPTQQADRFDFYCSPGCMRVNEGNSNGRYWTRAAMLNEEGIDVAGKRCKVCGATLSLYKPGQDENNLLHYSQVPVHAVCGSDTANQRTTQNLKDCNCVRCLAIYWVDRLDDEKKELFSRLVKGT